MAQFVDAVGSRSGGYPIVNLDLIARLRPIKGTDGRLDTYACENADGETVGHVSPSEMPLPGTVVPEARGTLLIGFHRWTNGDAPMFVSRVPVVAWRVIGDTAHPVTTTDLPDVYCLEHQLGPSTVWVFPYDTECDTFDAALQHAAKSLGIPAPEAAHA